MRFSLSALVVLASFFAPVAACANPIFTLTPVGGTSITFTLDPAAYDRAIDGVIIDYILPPNNSVFADFFHVGQGQGPYLDFVIHGVGSYGFNGPQLYAGMESSPTFIPGTYHLSYPGYNDATLIIRDTSITPEPSSFVLLGTGVLGVAAAGRRRFSKPSRTLTQG